MEDETDALLASFLVRTEFFTALFYLGAVVVYSGPLHTCLLFVESPHASTVSAGHLVLR